MNSRARDTGRHYTPGNAKRKAKEEKEKKLQNVISKTRKLSDFFNVVHNDAEFKETEVENTEFMVDSATFSTNETDIEFSANPTNLTESNSNQRAMLAHTSNIKPCTSQNDNNMYSNDIGEWPSSFDRDYWIAKRSSEVQNMNSDFLSSEKTYDNENKPRFCRKSFFTYTHKPTNKNHVRNWLCYSESKGKLFCFVCKIIGSCCSSRFTTEGFDDWKNGHNLLKRHEESIPHRQAIISLLVCKNKGARVDSQLVDQIETEKKYWQTLLKRITSVIIFLAERGLAFRGSNEIIGSSQNGNYLGLLELIAKFDDFLGQHINSHVNKGKGHTSYCSKTTCEEFIQIIATTLLDQIICEIKQCKYYSVSLDSTPDISHMDQLTLIIRYVLPSGPVERFVKFLDMEGHTAEQLAKSLFDFLKEYSIDIKDCRGQSYDNASNMSGKYRGLQARIKEHNKYAEYIPCFAHSLNLVAKCAAECCIEASIFFDFVENLYSFFSASTYRWGLLVKALENTGTKVPILKRLSDTRWSARADATKALLCSFKTIKDVLEKISNNDDQKVECRNQAYGLISKMSKLETGMMTILWNGILERLQASSAYLQSPDQDLNTGYAIYKSLHGYIQAIRPTFANIEIKAKILTGCEEYRQQTSRKRNRNTKYDNFSGSTTLDDVVENQTPSQKFEYHVFIVIIDNVLSALSKRMEAYHKITGIFGIFRQLKSLTAEEILKRTPTITPCNKFSIRSSHMNKTIRPIN